MAGVYTIRSFASYGEALAFALVRPDATRNR